MHTAEIEVGEIRAALALLVRSRAPFPKPSSRAARARRFAILALIALLSTIGLYTAALECSRGAGGQPGRGRRCENQEDDCTHPVYFEVGQRRWSRHDGCS
eukprot:5203881-Prymnesium_polylepis.1